MKGIILCAGEGERLKPLTDRIPKPMAPINGKPFLEYNIAYFKKYGINEILITTSHFPEEIKKYFGDGSKFGVKIHYSFEPKLLGTSGALNNFKDLLNETFVLLYGDELTNIDLNKMISYHREQKSIATIALRKKSFDYKTSSLILADNNLRITKFLEKPNEETVNKIKEEYKLDYKLLNSGIYVFEPEILKYIPEGFSDFAYDIFPKALESNQKLVGFLMDKYIITTCSIKQNP